MTTSFSPVIGIEMHVELNTVSKMFCGCPADHFGKTPNSQTCPVCLGLPGALPVPNKKAVEWTIAIGYALNCQINKLSKFDRKHYFYPDLPKGYQISQYDQPLADHGSVDIDLKDTKLQVKITRVHLEEDTGKLKHRNLEGKKVSLVDFNRSGVPLVEIVSEPDITSSDQAVAYAKHIQQLIRFLGASDADMEKGTMRLEANISLKQKDSKELPTYKVEVKNINSFRYLKAAIEFEIQRHTQLLKKGQTPEQETRGWNENKSATISQRSKESSKDYRYFPEPDIPPMVFDQKTISDICSNLPQFPQDYQAEFKKLGIRPDYVVTLTATPDMASWASNTFALASKTSIDSSKLANFLVNQNISPSTHNPEKVLEEFNKQTQQANISEAQLEAWISQVIADNPELVEKYQSGKISVIGAFVGEVMKLSHGQANPKQIKSQITERLRAI